MPTPPAEYLQQTYKKNAKFANEANTRAVEVSRDIAKEKTQYIEKIALAAGGTLALVVSFVWCTRRAIAAALVAAQLAVPSPLTSPTATRLPSARSKRIPHSGKPNSWSAPHSC